MKPPTRNRHGHRDATMILIAYRHGLRAAELINLRWDKIEFKSASPRPPGQTGHAQRASAPRRGVARPAAAAARAGPPHLTCSRPSATRR